MVILAAAIRFCSLNNAACFWACSESMALLWLWSTVCTLQWLPNLLITIILCPYDVWTPCDMGDFLPMLKGWCQRTETSWAVRVWCCPTMSVVIVKGWCLGTPRCACLLLSALLAGALCVQLHKLSDLHLQMCRLCSGTVCVSSSRWCSPKSTTETEIGDHWMY